MRSPGWKAYDALASVALDAAGQPRVRWWPVAYALQRVEDPRAFQALASLVTDPQPYTRAFAAKGLGALKNRSAVPMLVPLITGPDRAVAVEAIRALGRIGDPAAAPALLQIIRASKPDPVLRIEAVSAIGTVGAAGAAGVLDALLDILGDPESPRPGGGDWFPAARRSRRVCHDALSGSIPIRTGGFDCRLPRCWARSRRRSVCRGSM